MHASYGVATWGLLCMCGCSGIDDCDMEMLEKAIACMFVWYEWALLPDGVEGCGWAGGHGGHAPAAA